MAAAHEFKKHKTLRTVQSCRSVLAQCKTLRTGSVLWRLLQISFTDFLVSFPWLQKIKIPGTARQKSQEEQIQDER